MASPFFLCAALTIALSAAKQPNILFLLIDDLGWNDIGFHGGCDYETPNLDLLSESALHLNNYYVQHYCTQTRSALLSGRYPYHDGLQDQVIQSYSPYGLNTNITTLAEEMKRSGYNTHMLGKWHIGFFTHWYTPTYRGFDTFIGYYGDEEDYYGKNRTEDGLKGIDFRNGLKPVLSTEYSTYIYGNETMRILSDYVAAGEDNEEPFFIYWASQAAHQPWTAPVYKIEEHNSIKNADRRQLAAVVSTLDDVVGDVVSYLKSEESNYLWEDLLLIVSSDNGGDVTEGANNFPLRGSKRTLWEGGVKAVSFVTGGWLPDDRRGVEMNALMHVTDWLPTLCAIAGISPLAPFPLDGYDQSDNIIDGEVDIYAPRESIVHNVLSASCTEEGSVCGAVRWRNYKLVVGSEVDWTGDEACMSTWCTVPEMIASETSIQCSSEGNMVFSYPDDDTFLTDSCVYNGDACIFDIEMDPCEYNDIAGEESVSDIYDILYSILLEANATQVDPLLLTVEADYKGADPKNHGGFWSPWMDVDISSTAEGHQHFEVMEEEDTVSDSVSFEWMSYNARRIGAATARMIDHHHAVSLAVVCSLALMMFVIVQIHWWWQKRRESGYKHIGEQKSTLSVVS